MREPTRRGDRRRVRVALFASLGLHAIAVLVVAGTPIERPASRDGPPAIGVTLLAEEVGAPAERAGERVAPPRRSEPITAPEPTPRAEPVAKPPASARSVRPPPSSPPAPRSDRGAAGGETGKSTAESGVAAPADGGEAGAAPLPAPGSGASSVYGEHEVDRVAGPVGGIRRPSYPARERMLGREGQVALRVTVDPGGGVRGVEVTRSAGDAFDAAARRAVEATPFRPAERGGLAVASTVTVNVSFELD